MVNMSITRNYALMDREDIRKYIPDMQALGVSEVARSPKGFLFSYMQYGSRMLDTIPPDSKITWRKIRENFIHRHLEQYKKNPTPRRRLALIAWAYSPGHIKLRVSALT
jgi:hypothetical protein